MRILLVLAPFFSSFLNTYGAPSGELVKLSPEYFHPIESLYHSQDMKGHYVYGYATPTISKSETKSADGVTQGGYSYIDADGHLQTVQYTADPIHGFRVAASNLPVESPDVAHARAIHLAEFEAIKAERAQVAATPYFNPVAVPHGQVPELVVDQQLPQPVTDLPEVARARAEHLAALHAAYTQSQIAQVALPQPVQDLPEVVKARAEHLAAVQIETSRQAQLRAEISLSPIPSDLSGYVVPVQTHAGGAQPLPVAPAARIAYTPEQYGYGPYSYGYIGPHSAKSETQSSDGTVRGGYSYIDAYGIVQTVNYIADKAGFRVAATNIPVDKHHLAVSGGIPAVSGSVPSVAVARSASPVAVEAEKKFIVPALYTSEVAY